MQPNTWAMICHLAGFAGYLGNLIGCIIGPLVVWLLKKDEIPEVDEHGKEALNFNISVTIYFLILMAASGLTFGIGLLVTIPLSFVLVVFHLVCVIVAATKANNGEVYRYPMCIRLVN